MDRVRIRVGIGFKDRILVGIMKVLLLQKV